MTGALTFENLAVLTLCVFAVPFGTLAGIGFGLWFLGWLDGVTSWMTRR